jgi:nicotinate-nucleotide adenylyltransferase
MSDKPIRQRVGIFGGSFDPIHIGHLLIAEQAREQLRLDQIRFIPAAVSPLKQGRQPVDAKHRVEMVRLAVGGNPFFTVDDRELRRGGTSYTVDTLKELKSELPHSDLCFLMGADSLAEFHLWREPELICQLAFVVVVARGGHPPPDLKSLARYLPADQQDELESHLIFMPQLEISSRDIRHRFGARQSVRYLVPAAVEAYMNHHALYAVTAS